MELVANQKKNPTCDECGDVVDEVIGFENAYRKDDFYVCGKCLSMALDLIWAKED